MSNPLVLSALDRYANANRAVQKHIEEHPEIFKAHEALVGAQIDARSALEDAAVATANPDGVTVTDNGEYKVTVTPRKNITVNPDDLRSIKGRIVTDDILAVLIKTQERPPTVNVTSAPASRV